eukprot:Ihof_evm4s269 gene=Ihof_evmTU4s269
MSWLLGDGAGHLNNLSKNLGGNLTSLTGSLAEYAKELVIDGEEEEQGADEYNYSTADMDQLENENAAQHNLLQQQASEIKRLKTQLDMKVIENFEYQRVIEEKETTIVELTGQIANVSANEMTPMALQSSTSTREPDGVGPETTPERKIIESMEEKEREREKEIEKQRVEYNRNKQECERLSKEMLEMKAEMDERKRQNAIERERATQTLQAEVTTLKQKINSLQSLAKDSNLSLGNESESEQIDKVVLESQIGIANEEIVGLKGDIEKEMKKRRVLEEKEKENKKLLAQLEDDLNDLKLRKMKIIEEREIERERMKDVCEELERERERRKEIEAKVERDSEAMRHMEGVIESQSKAMIKDQEDIKIDSGRQTLDTVVDFEQRLGAMTQERDDFQNQVQQLQKINNKKEQQLERLREHMLDSETQYTIEAMSQQSEVENLTQQLEKLAKEREVSCQEELKREAELRDMRRRLEKEVLEKNDMLEQMVALQEEIKQQNTSLSNLQMVLAANQNERVEEIQLAVGSLRKEKLALSKELERLDREAAANQKEISYLKDQVITLSKNQSQEDEKNDTIRLLKAKVGSLQEQQLESHEKMMQLLTSADENTVDKRLIKNVLISYLNLGHKSETLILLAKILSFTDEEKQQVGLLPSAGGSIFGFLPSINLAPPLPRNPSEALHQ